MLGLYDVKRRTVYTPNTNQWATPAMPEARYAPDQSRDESGRFADEGKGAGTRKEKVLTTTADGGMIITAQQFGKKNGKHARGWGLNPASADDRKRFVEIVSDIYANSDTVKVGTWRGQRNKVLFYIKGNDAVIMRQDGTFVSVLKGGVNNGRIKDAGER